MKNLRSIGYFSRILKKNGTLLFNSKFRDNEFLLDIKTIYHTEFLTDWTIESIKKVSKGFHIKLKEADDQETASYFIGEDFSIPEEQIKGRSVDLLVGGSVFRPDGEKAGTIISISDTPGYMLAEIENPVKKIFFLPLTDEFVSFDKDKIILLKELE